MSKTKKSLFIATIAVSLMLAVIGVSFAAWSITYKNDSKGWTVSANTPGELTITELVAPTGIYNGETDFVSTATATLTSNTDITTLSAKLTLTSDKGTTADASVSLVDATTGDVVTALDAGISKNIKIIVTFGDYSASSFYGATFTISVVIGVNA